ncbi:MAG: alpha/beta hydrolase [Acidobacteria bacterium]|nr:alpha/beta hydrolase [Acidobacteriota bacterium]
MDKGAALFLLVLAVGGLSDTTNALAESESTRSTIDKDGTVHAAAFEIPFSSLASEEAKKVFIEESSSMKAKASFAEGLSTTYLSTPEGLTEFILRWRKSSDEERKKIAQEMTKIYPVTVTPEVFGGVQTDVVMPRDGVSAQNENRVLINLHGGGMIFGARYEGQVMSIPIASVGGLKVITVDYRMAPEHRFPAASEDVAAVYAELLKRYRPENIGIYGCSAGGYLTAQSLAWFQVHNLPRPGAVGILCFGWGGGDSSYVASVLSGGAAPTEPRMSSKNPAIRALGLCASQANPRDPLVNPMSSTAVLAKFPSTLFINSTRDGMMSGAIHSHLQLIKAGVDAELYLWDGLGHAFMYDTRLPESHEVYNIMVKFFDKHLGHEANH